jgi:voltage-gated potassium channel Kch
MISNLVLGLAMTTVNLAVQVAAILGVLRYLNRKVRTLLGEISWRADFTMILSVILVLLLGHLVQSSIWAATFMMLGEFTNFDTALYFSLVNFTSLGYGDIVMSDRHRLLGALEAANGVMMFGLTAGGVLSIMTGLFSRHFPNVAAATKHDR